jgi:hypothetical protein
MNWVLRGLMEQADLRERKERDRMTAKTTSERQRAFRARKDAEQVKEVRGLFAHAGDHAAIVEYAAKLARKRAKAKPSEDARPLLRAPV